MLRKKKRKEDENGSFFHIFSFVNSTVCVSSSSTYILPCFIQSALCYTIGFVLMYTTVNPYRITILTCNNNAIHCVPIDDINLKFKYCCGH